MPPNEFFEGPILPPLKEPCPVHCFSNPLLMGSIIIVIGLVGLVLSYNAHRGLPFVPTYDVSVDVPDAAELVAGSSEVRIGGARVGLVQSVRAMPGHDGRPAFSRLGPIE